VCGPRCRVRYRAGGEAAIETTRGGGSPGIGDFEKFLHSMFKLVGTFASAEEAALCYARCVRQNTHHAETRDAK
jgi:hypothetical protein